MKDVASSQNRLSDLIPAIVLLVMSVLGILSLVCQPGKAQRQLAVVLPPWDSVVQAAALVTAAGGTLVDGGGLPDVVIATSDRPDFSHALYQAGAWFVMNPIGAHGCLARPSTGGTSP
jgi:hypothetical protein